jgi:hypothetical protein
MAQKLDSKEIVSIEEVLLSQVIQVEVLVDMLAEQGIIDKEDMLESIKKMKEKLYK